MVVHDQGMVAALPLRQGQGGARKGYLSHGSSIGRYTYFRTVGTIRLADLADLEEVPVRIAKEPADLIPAVDRRGRKGAPRDLRVS
jgi:hypothetical protein